MTRKKRGFWTFCFSLIPGAGEMYIGFLKQGVSIMAMFALWLAFCSYARFEIGLFILPILWFYSFFHVHNLVSLPDAEFYAQEDEFLFIHMDRIFGVDKWERGKVKFIAVALIFIGGYTILSTLWRTLWSVLPTWLYRELSEVRNGLPRIVISLILIAFGIYLIRGKKEKLDKEPEVVYDMPLHSEPKPEEKTAHAATPVSDVIILPDTKGDESV